MIYGYFKLNANINNGHKKLIAIIQTGAQPENICFDALGSSAELTKLMTTLRQGDMLVVYSTVDIATAPAELTDMMDFLGKLGVSFVVVAEPWLSSSAQPERNGNPERILPANTHPRHGEVQKKSVGRPKGPQRDIIPKLDLALNLYHTAHHMSIRQICAMAKLNEKTFYRHLERKGYQVIRRLKGRKPTKKIRRIPSLNRFLLHGPLTILGASLLKGIQTPLFITIFVPLFR